MNPRPVPLAVTSDYVDTSAVQFLALTRVQGEKISPGPGSKVNRLPASIGVLLSRESSQLPAQYGSIGLWRKAEGQ